MVQVTPEVRQEPQAVSVGHILDELESSPGRNRVRVTNRDTEVLVTSLTENMRSDQLLLEVVLVYSFYSV